MLLGSQRYIQIIKPEGKVKKVTRQRISLCIHYLKNRKVKVKVENFNTGKHPPVCYTQGPQVK